MSPLNSLILGLGLFFLGLRLAGDNFKALCSGGFRSAVAATTKYPVLTSALGFGAGMVMQSATAVTFISVSMVAAGLIASSAAGLVIVWCNVGLTMLAFVATWNIHPLVGYVIGGSGIVLGVVRIRTWQTIAGVLLGLGMILFGLEQMSAGAAPLKDAPWFQPAIHAALANPFLSFGAGILLATVLQSNTGATMMIITLAGVGAVDPEHAALLIYGTNLGAIPLRIVLASGLGGEALRLVRLEDLFCAFSGVLLMTLYFLEKSGIPLVFALAGHLGGSTDARLAVIFLLSNLLPALVLTPLLPTVRKALNSWFPGQNVHGDGTPVFLTPQAVDDPPTALDLLRKELAVLLRSVNCSPLPSGDAEDMLPPPDFQKRSEAIEEFAAKLASRSNLNKEDASILHLLRAILSGIRHFEEAARTLCSRVHAEGPSLQPGQLEPLLQSIQDTRDGMSDGLDAPSSGTMTLLRNKTKRHGEFFGSVKEQVFANLSVSGNLAAAALSEDFEITIWTLHRLAKILERLVRKS